MTVVVSRVTTRMSDKCQVGHGGRSKQLRRSKTISVTQYLNKDGAPNIDESFSEEISETKPSSPPWLPTSCQPTSSCQALKHAVSALTHIDDFLLEVLGEGFFANVYKATHKATGEQMVMKVNKDTANRSSSLREIQLMKKLSHPNILRFLGVCVHEGQLHALTEYISGGTLEELLADKTEELPWMLRIKLALDIAQGMHYIHGEGVFHRDLTSMNILIKKNNNKNYQAVIADFGLATKIPDARATEPLPPVGCPWWMAPEVINARFYDERADLFSYGIILLEMTARIEADPESMPRSKNFGVDYVKFCEMVDYCPLDFLQLAFSCCQIQPEQRPNCSTIINTIERIHAHLHSSTLSSPGKWYKRSKSEDNIIKNREDHPKSAVQEMLRSPQIIALHMTKDDPHYSPAIKNPFANLSILKDGRKLHEYPKPWKPNGSSGLEGCGKAGDLMTLSQNSAAWSEMPESLSLPSSPLMLRKAAEKLHQASLHGIDAVKADSKQSLDLILRFSFLESKDSSAASDKRDWFSSNRTRSLGSLDFWSTQVRAPTSNRSRKGRNPKLSNQPGESRGSNRFSAGIRESSIEDKQETDRSGFGESYNSAELDVNIHGSMNSHIYYSLNNNEGGAALDNAGLAGGWGDDTCSLSSFVSCDGLADWEEAVESPPGVPDSCPAEKQKRLPLRELRSLMGHKKSEEPEGGRSCEDASLSFG